MIQIGDIVHAGGFDWLILGFVDGKPVGVRSMVLDNAVIAMESNVVSHELARHINDIHGSLPLNLVKHCSDPKLVDIMRQCDRDIAKFNWDAANGDDDIEPTAS